MISGVTTFPASRVAKMPPIVRSKINPTSTRESAQAKTAANGCCFSQTVLVLNDIVPQNRAVLVEWRHVLAPHPVCVFVARRAGQSIAAVGAFILM